MEDCTICYQKTNKWKVLPCHHKLCKKCYIKLRQATCPYCRREFTYTKEEQIKRHNLYISNRNHPPSQLRLNNTINIEEYTNYNIVNSRIERNRTRRRRRNLSMKEIQERRRLIKKRCKSKWNKKYRRTMKNNWWNIEVN
jgi:hypothetical protein